MARKGDLKELAAVFLKLGIIGFGGPAAHIAMMQGEVVKKRKWLTEQEFMDLLGATNLIPGPNSTEMAIHIGQERAGWKGLITAGLCFIFPAVAITAFLAWLYGQYGKLPNVQPFLYGVKPAIIAVIVMAVVPLAKKSLKTDMLCLLGLAVLAGTLLGFSEIIMLFGAGLIALLIKAFRRNLYSSPFATIPILLSYSNSVTISDSNGKLFFLFLKVGSILYGSGYVLFAFLDSELVARGLLTRSALIDAIAVGHFTPGPVFSAVTFIGYQINGFMGAAVATAGIFLPSFVFVAMLNPLVRYMRNSQLFSAFLDAVNVASIAIILAVCIDMAGEIFTDRGSIFITLGALASQLIFKRVNSVYVVLGGALAGYILKFAY